MSGVCRRARAKSDEHSCRLNSTRFYLTKNLAARLAAELADLYPGCAHVADRRQTGGSNRAIWQYAQGTGLSSTCAGPNTSTCARRGMVDPDPRLGLRRRRPALTGWT